MKQCPACAKPLADQDVVCHSCGRALPTDPAFVLPNGPIHQLPNTPVHQEQVRTAAEPPSANARRQSPDRSHLMRWLPGLCIGAAGAVILLLIAGGLGGRGSAEKVEAAPDSSARPTPVASSSGQQRGTVPVMKWNQVKQSPWGRDGLRTVAFELPAEEDVRVWMKRVRPLLVVRCLSKNTEVFIVTSSAASFEKNAGRHTVHVGFDGTDQSAEQWEDSVDSQQLFAPDGEGMARRIAEARTMTFRFTPFNASPVTAQFNVAGFDEHLQAVAKTCRWRP